MGRFVSRGALLLCVALGACEGDVHKQIHGHIYVVVNRDDALVAPAVQSLVARQTQILPQVETALHTARPVGRLRLLEVLSRVRHTETVPLLRHFALFDADPRVRTLAESTLKTWQASEASPLATAADVSLRWLGAKRALGLGPLVREE